MGYGIEIHLPFTNFSTNVKGFPRRVSGQAEQVDIQQNLQYMGKKIKMVPNIQPLNTMNDIRWSIVEGGSYASINSSTGELTIKDNAITQMVKVKATSLTNSSIFDEREIVLTYKDVDEIDLPVYQIIVTGLQDEYVYVNNERTYTLKFSVYPGLIDELFFEVIDGQDFINISDISSVDNYTYITFSFVDITDETTNIKLHVFDYGDSTVETTVDIIVKARIENIGFRNIPNGNIIPDIVYSFDYYTDPVLQRAMDVSIIQNNNLVESYYVNNINGTAGTINFVRKNLEIGQNQDVVFRVADAQDLSNYKDASIVFAPVANHRINVYDNLPVYEYDPSTNVYYSFRWQEVPTVERELSVQVIEPSTGSITYNLTDVSFGSGKFNFRPNSINDIGNFTVKIYDEDNTSFYTDVNFLVHNTVGLYNTSIRIHDFLCFSGYGAGDSVDSLNYNNYGENFFGDISDYYYANIPAFANSDTYNIINIKKHYGDIVFPYDSVTTVPKEINFEMYFGTDNQVFNTVNIEVIGVSSNISVNDITIQDDNISADLTGFNGHNIQIKVRIYLNTGEYKIYEINVEFIDISDCEKLYITDDIRESNNLPSLMMTSRYNDFSTGVYIPGIDLYYLYDVEHMYITLMNGNINDYICIAATGLPINNNQDYIHGAFVLDKEKGRFVFDLDDLKGYIKRNNQVDSPGSNGWIGWAYDTDGHEAYNTEFAENSYKNGGNSFLMYFILFEKNSFTLTNRFLYSFGIALNGTVSQNNEYIPPTEVSGRNQFKIYTTKSSLRNTNVISLPNLYCFDLCDRNISGNIPNNIFTGNIIINSIEGRGQGSIEDIIITKTKKIKVEGGSTISFNKIDLLDFDDGDLQILVECNYNFGQQVLLNYNLE